MVSDHLNSPEDRSWRQEHTYSRACLWVGDYLTRRMVWTGSAALLAFPWRRGRATLHVFWVRLPAAVPFRLCLHPSPLSIPYRGEAPYQIDRWVWLHSHRVSVLPGANRCRVGEALTRFLDG